jgi:hypothetical protein
MKRSFSPRGHTLFVSHGYKDWELCQAPKLNRRLPETRNSVGLTQDLCFGLAGGFDDKIIRAAGPARAAFFVCAKSEHAGNLLGGGELLRKARVYVCKPDRLVMQASSEFIEECSC